jgi:hypothetical protein
MQQEIFEMKTDNPELKLAAEFVRDTGCNLFLTGKAGTGKTTFLHSLKKNSHKRFVVTAPTGVAAINAGGVTLHSFFQLPFGPFIPGMQTARSQYRFSRKKIDIIVSLDLLVIDEISMVRADLLDGVDSVLRHHRRSELPFGGVQLLMIGDLFQLPPVVKDEDWRLLAAHYASPYFFSSSALQKTDMVTIELRHIYRQSDSRFIDLLNRVRNDRLDPAALGALNTRHIADFESSASEGVITLSTHNRSADAINASRLEALPQKIHTFDAEIEGDFPDHAHPAAATLRVKPGAQVMFVRNDPSPEKRFFNGKIGTITQVAGKDIHIKCPDDSAAIVVEPATWENIEYKLDPKTLEITENKIGAFKQYPLRLAWAITIHKSQGLTFDRAVIDAQAAFAHGQIYVALSRCRTLEGLVLSTPISSTTIKTDPAVRHFSEEAKRNGPTADQLEAATIQYQQKLLMECFDYQRIRTGLHRMVTSLSDNPGLIHGPGGSDIRKLQKKVEDEICTVADSFCRQLQGLFSATTPPVDDVAVVGRIVKASAYFQEKIVSVLGQRLSGLHFETDNQKLGRNVGNSLKFLQESVAVKLAAMQSCADGFRPSRYFRAVSAAAINTGRKKSAPESAIYAETDITHPELFQTLKTWRSRKAEEEGIARYQVLHQKPLIQIAVDLPDTLAALKGIRGIGPRLAERYGQELVAMVGAYRRQHKIEVVTRPTLAPADGQVQKQRTSRMDTKQISLVLFEKGLTPAQIANARGLVLTTIEGHMAHWVATGKVEIDSLLSPKKRKTIERQLALMQGKPVGAIKQALGADISYAEIRLVQAHLKHRMPA